MITVSNTTPLRYLIEIEAADILQNLFGQIIIPEKVAEELQRPKTHRRLKPGYKLALLGWKSGKLIPRSSLRSGKFRKVSVKPLH